MARKFLFVVLMILLSSVLVASLFSNVDAQTCTLRTQGYLGGCFNVNVRWFTQSPAWNSAQPSTPGVLRFDLNTFAGKFSASGNAQSYSIPASCGSGGQVTITEVWSTGLTCTAQYSGNLPHNRPCDQCAGVGGGMSIVSAASFRGDLAAGSIASAFNDPNAEFTPVTAQALALPLPMSLSGVQCFVADRPVGLFYASPHQVNFLLPADLPPGLHVTRITNAAGQQFIGQTLIVPNAPGIFTRDSTGGGLAASVLLPFGGVNYLLLFGTGFVDSDCTLHLGNGRSYRAEYCGPAPGFAGLTQMNVRVPASEMWNGTLGAFVRVRGAEGHWDSAGFDLRP